MINIEVSAIVTFLKLSRASLSVILKTIVSFLKYVPFIQFLHKPVKVTLATHKEVFDLVVLVNKSACTV